MKKEFVVWAAILFSDGADFLNSAEGTGYQTSNMVTHNWTEYNKALVGMEQHKI
jgi:hypothetical protein